MLPRRCPLALAGLGVAVSLVATGCSASTGIDGPAAGVAPTSSTTVALGATSVPVPAPESAESPSGATSRPAHIVVVVEENRSARDILGSPDARYLNELAAEGTSMTDLHAIRHPSQPNYVALFSGSTHGLVDDSCPHLFAGPDLAGEVRASGRTFAGYAEGLPSVGFLGCARGRYVRKHCPWTDFTDVPRSATQPFTAFPANYALLPTLSFVIPDLDHDMHDGTIAQGDRWLRDTLGGYARWAARHNSMLVVTWDEDDHSEGNRIPTIIVGQHVRVGPDATPSDLYSLLKTLESLLQVPALGASQDRLVIAGL